MRDVLFKFHVKAWNKFKYSPKEINRRVHNWHIVRGLYIIQEVLHRNIFTLKFKSIKVGNRRFYS